MRVIAACLFLLVAACAHQAEPISIRLPRPTCASRLRSDARGRLYRRLLRPGRVEDASRSASAFNVRSQSGGGRAKAQIAEAQGAARDPAVQRRARALAAYVASARFRLDMIDGERLPFADETSASSRCGQRCGRSRL